MSLPRSIGLHPLLRSLYRTGSVALLSLPVLVLGGCSLFKSEGPERSADVLGEIPADWVTPQGVAPFAEGWLNEFADPQIDSLVDEVWTHNALLLAAISRRDAAAARAQIDQAALVPKVNFQAQAGRQRQINDFLGDSLVIPEETYISRMTIGLGITWELDVWGRVQNGAKAALGEVWAASLEVEAAKFSLAGQTASQWFGLIAADRRLAASSALAANHEQAVQFSRERYALGLLSAAELRQAETEYALAQAEKIGRELERGRAARSLEVLLGRYPANTLESSTGLPPMPPALDAGVPSEMLERRPDVQAAAIRLMASDQRLLAAKKNLLPRFTIQASGATQAKYRDYLFTEDSFVWSLGGGLLQPLFDGGQIRAGIRAQRALMFEAIQRYRDEVYTAFREVEDGLAADAGLRRQRQHLQRSYELAQESASSARERFEGGSIDARMLLASERSVLVVEQRLLELDLAALNNRVALNLALGGRPTEDIDPQITLSEASPGTPPGTASGPSQATRVEQSSVRTAPSAAPAALEPSP